MWWRGANSAWRKADMVLSNAALVYCAQLCRLAVPVLILPVIARRLDIDQFAALASAQALAYLVMIIPEYGFGTHGPRAIAQLRDNRAALGAETRRILLAKLVLCAPAMVFAAVAGFFLPSLLGDWRIIAAMLVLGLMLGLGPGWFFQGTGKARIYAALDIAALLAFLGLVLVMPLGPRDAWLVLTLQAVTLGAAVLAGHLVMRKTIGSSGHEKTSISAALRSGFPMFLTKLASNIPGLGLLYIIGYALRPDALAHYAAAERLLMGSANALWPVMQILMPEIAERYNRDPASAKKLFQRGLGILLAIGFALSAFLFFLAPWIVAVMFGPKFGPTVESLRILALALPCIALTNGISNGILVARGKDWLLTGAIFASAMLSAGLALTLIGPEDYHRVALIRTGVEVALALGLVTIALIVVRKEG
jgi:polysaccharide transporter, PST family